MGFSLPAAIGRGDRNTVPRGPSSFAGREATRPSPDKSWDSCQASAVTSLAAPCLGRPAVKVCHHEQGCSAGRQKIADWLCAKMATSTCYRARAHIRMRLWRRFLSPSGNGEQAVRRVPSRDASHTDVWLEGDTPVCRAAGNWASGFVLLKESISPLSWMNCQTR